MGSTSTVRIPEATKRELEEAAEELGIPQAKVVSVALKELRKRLFFKRVAEDFERLRADPAASKEYDKELAAWDVTLSDGLPPER
jgi:antitoxin component of RelBE/YafQ-DinJ toxin-antitoxin module